MSAASPAAARGPDRLRFLDGLRGWAAFIVVVYHSTWELFKGYVPAMRTAKPGLLNDGKLAVYVFFVLSGLVLSYPFLKTLRRSQLAKLALRRYLRLTIPIAAASLLALIMLEMGWFYNQQANAIVHSDNWLGSFYHFAPSVLGWARFSFWGVYFHYDTASSYDIVLWTMEYELAGSFLVFGMLALGGSSLPARLFIYAVTALICRWEAPMLEGFVFGTVIAELMLSRFVPRLSPRLGDVAGTVLLAAAFLGSMLLRSTYSPQRCAWLALLVVIGVVISGRWRMLLETRISRWLGRISFPLYLVHTLVICGPVSLLILWLSARGWSGVQLVVPVAASTITVSLAAATIFAPIEQLAINTSHAFSRIVLDSSRPLWQFVRRGALALAR